MVISYGRNGGSFMLLMLAAVAFAAAMLAVVVTGTLLLVAAAVAILGRALLPPRRRHRPVRLAPAAYWRPQAVGANVIEATAYPGTRDPAPMDRNAT